MMNLPQRLYNLRFAVRRIVALVLLVAALMSAHSQPSYSCGCAPGICFCCGAWVCPVISDIPAESANSTMDLDFVSKLAHWAAAASQWYTDNVATAVTSGAKIAAARLNNQMKTRSSQGVVDGEVQAKLAGASGKEVAQSMMAETSSVCANTRTAQERARADYATNAMVHDFTSFGAKTGSGTKADTSSAAYIAIEVNDLCQLGFIGNDLYGRYGSLASNMSCAVPATGDPTRYVNADMQMTSVTGPLQFPMPIKQHVYQTDDGHVTFSGPSGNADPDEPYPGLGSEMDFVAAYKYCDELQYVLPTPTHSSGAVSIAEVANIREDRKAVAVRSAAVAECKKAIAYRTSCPQGASTALQTQTGSDCFTAQHNLCLRLKASRSDGGLGLTMVGSNPVFQTALQYCDTMGLSAAMYDAIRAHRCEDDNYKKNLPIIMGGSMSSAEHISSAECDANLAAYDKAMERKTNRLLTSIDISMKSGGGPSVEVGRGIK